MKYRLEETVPHCLECGNPLPYGRKDRKYCCPACKNRSHNRDARQWRIRYASVISILQKNHDILRHLVQVGIRTIAKEELVQLGYRLGFVTSSGREGCRRGHGHPHLGHCARKPSLGPRRSGRGIKKEAGSIRAGLFAVREALTRPSAFSADP